MSMKLNTWEHGPQRRWYMPSLPPTPLPHQVRLGGAASKLHVELWVPMPELLWHSRNALMAQRDQGSSWSPSSWLPRPLSLFECRINHMWSCDPAANFTKDPLGTALLREAQCQFGLLWSPALVWLGDPQSVPFPHLLLVSLWWGWGLHYVLRLALTSSSQTTDLPQPPKWWNYKL